MGEEEDLKAAALKKRNLLILVWGVALLTLPIIFLVLSKLASYRKSASASMNGSIFYARTISIGSKISPAQAPAPPTNPSGLTPPPATSAQSSLNLIVGYKGPPIPPPPTPQKSKIKNSRKKPFHSKSLSQIQARKPVNRFQPVSAPKLKPSPFGNSPTQANAPAAPNVGGQIPNVQNILQGALKGQNIPPQAQQMIQQATQGQAPPVPSPGQ